MISDKIFSDVVSWYKSYPYKQAIYTFRDEKDSAYVYTKIDNDGNNPIKTELGLQGDVLPLFYEEGFAFYFSSRFPELSIKMISHQALKLLSLWCENDRVKPIFLTTIDRRSCGEKEIDKNKSGFKRQFEHFLFDKNNINF
jgi:hypothetical protein